MNRPDAVVDFLESDGVLLQRVGDEEQALLKPKCPRVRDALDDEMSGILDRRQCAGVEPRRRPIPRRGRGALEELVRPLVVVLGAEAIERALLGRERARGGRIGSALSVLCIRSCAPFSCGDAGLVR